MKTCPGCNISKSFDAFAKHSKRHDGLQVYCRVCKSEYDKKYVQKNKGKHAALNKLNRRKARQYVYDFLKTHPCVDCGENNIVCLDFDHIDPKSKFKSVSALVHSLCVLSTIQKEMDKCEVRCSNCHRKKTAEDFNWYSDLDR